MEASVTGRRQSLVGSRSSTRRAVLLLRAAAASAVLGVVVYALWARHAARVELDQKRTALTRDWSDARKSVGAQGEQLLSQVENLIANAASQAGVVEYVAQDLRREGAFAAAMTRPMIYLRIPIATAATHAAVAAAAAQSGKDSFLLCLLDPPRPANEKAFLPKARAALAGGSATHQLAPDVFRLHELEKGSAQLSAAWGDGIAGARDARALARLQRDFEKTPILSIKALLRAELLVATLDEADDVGGVTEMDGEHAHHVRVAVWDLKRAQLLLNLRRHVDPSWITPNRRSQYAREFDSCKLAVAVHDAVATDSEH